MMLKINDTSSIAVAELSGILHALLSLQHLETRFTPTVHIVADNKYAIDVCNRKCRVNIRHMPLLVQIKQCIHNLHERYTIKFHWIPGHTNNPLHTKCDRYANAAALSQRSLVDPFTHLAYFTDAPASGWAWPSP